MESNWRFNVARFGMVGDANFRLCARYLNAGPGYDVLLTVGYGTSICRRWFAFPGSLPEFFDDIDVGGNFPGNQKALVEADN